MSFGISAGTAALIGGGLAAGASVYGANQQADAARAATSAQQGMSEQTRADQAPWRAAGQVALGQIGQMSAPGGQFLHEFNADDLKSNLAPNYDFQLQQGLGAVQNSAAAKGGLVGGNALKAINDYAQNFAGNAYQNAFNNYTTNQNNIYSRLASISGLGQTAGSVSSTGANDFSRGIADTTVGAGTAIGSGIIGAGNAINKGLNNSFAWNAYSDNNSSNVGGYGWI